MNKHLTRSKLNLPVEGVLEKKHLTGKYNNHQDIEEAFIKYCSDFIINLDYPDERYLLSFIHDLIDNNNKEWERNILNIFEECHNKKYGTYDYKQIVSKIFNNLLKGK